MAKSEDGQGEGPIVATLRGGGKHAARSLRAGGGVPAVLYGHGAPVPIALGAREASAIQHMPRNHVFPLRPGSGRAETVRLVALQREATTGRILHLDLERVVRGERSRVAIAVLVEGEEQLGQHEAVVTRLVETLEIEGETMHLPPSVTVDVSALAPGDRVAAGDVSLPAGVTLLTAPDTAVLQVGRAHVGAVEAPAAAEAEAEGAAGAKAAAGEAGADKA